MALGGVWAADGGRPAQPIGPAAASDAAEPLPGRKFKAPRAAFADADSSLLLLGRRGGIAVVDADTGQELFSKAFGDVSYSAGLSAQGRYVYFQGRADPLRTRPWVTRVWERASGKLVFEAPYEFAYTARSAPYLESRFFYFSPDERYAVSLDARADRRAMVAKVYALPEFSLQAELPVSDDVNGPFKDGGNVGISTDGRLLAVADRLYALSPNGPPAPLQPIRFPLTSPQYLEAPKVAGRRPWVLFQGGLRDLRSGQWAPGVDGTYDGELSQDGETSATRDFQSNFIRLTELETGKTLAQWPASGEWGDLNKPEFLGGVTAEGVYSLSRSGILVFWNRADASAFVLGSVPPLRWRTLAERAADKAVDTVFFFMLGPHYFHRRPYVFATDAKHLLIGDEEPGEWTCYGLPGLPRSAPLALRPAPGR